MSARDRERALVERCQAGDSSAWEELVPYYRDHLVRYATACAGPLDAEDLAQEALLDAWRRIREYDPGRIRLGSWLQILARGRCSAHRRKADALHRGSCEFEDWMEKGYEPVTSEVEARDILGQLGEMIQQLSPREKQAIEGVLDGEAQHVMAQRCGSTRKSLSMALTGARRKLRGMTQMDAR